MVKNKDICTSKNNCVYGIRHQGMGQRAFSYELLAAALSKTGTHVTIIDPKDDP